MALTSRFLLRYMTVAIVCTCVLASSLYFVPHETVRQKVGDYPFWNTSLPWNQRVDDLVSRLTLEEIQLQMSRGGSGEYGGPAPAIPRLGIGAYNWDTECLRGDAETAGNATAFPQALGLAATFSPDLLFRVAAAAGSEVRGKHNDFVRRGIYASHTGASCFSPVINIARDPRWGRNQETYGEDPFLTGILSENFVRGLQGNDSRYVQASAGCKHFDAHGGPEDIPVNRMTFNALVSDIDWRMTFLPAFKKCVQAGTLSLMCSYNSINGVPSCANKKLLTDILRDEWNFTGYVVSDESAIENIINDHHYFNNSIDTAAACINAGCNLELSPNLVQPVYLSIGIGAYNWDTECLRGDAETAGNATAFPQALGLAATFSPDLLFRVAAAAGSEVRGKHNDFVRRGIYASHTGASCFSPVINIARDPRWGRNQETYGEDPFLTGILSENFVRGLQGNDSRYVQASAGCKHFDAHGGPEDIPVNRMTFNALVSDIDWRMTFLPAFKKCVQAGTLSLMCSYNSINGVPSCANKKLLTDILRDEWNFTGYVVSDESAIENIINDHHYFNNSIDTAAACINAGCNLELSPNLVQPVYLSIVDAVNQGKLSENLVRERVKPLFYTRMRLGEFDPPELNPYAKLDSSVAESPEHQSLASEAAIKSFVLLKNQNNILPLNVSAFRRVAVIGPMANNVSQLFGNYSPNQGRSFTKTPVEALKQLFPKLINGTACTDGTPCQQYNSSVVKRVVGGADLIFVILGTGQVLESEDTDRADVNLPGKQQLLLQDTMSYNPNASIILLLLNAGPLNVSVFDESDQVSAIMECFFPAQAAGDALVAVLTNKGGNSSPAGRLPMTWPRFDWQIPPMVNYSMEGRTYRYMNTHPLYPFGYGLSYSHFVYVDLILSDDVLKPQRNLTVTVLLKNNGSVSADEVLQCYISWGNQSLPVPIRQLVYFTRIHIVAGDVVTHTFTVSWDNWAYWNNGEWAVHTGVMHIFCGGQQPFQRKQAPSNILSKTFTVIGTS